MSREATSTTHHEPVIVLLVIAFTIIDVRSSPDHPLGDAIETFVCREGAERFIEEVRGDDPVLASCLRVEERELEAGGRGSTHPGSAASGTPTQPW